MNTKQLFLFFTLIFSTIILQAQPINRSTYEKNLAAADTALAKMDYYNALEKYEECYDDKKEVPIAYKIAQLQLYLRDYVQAEKWFAKVSRVRKNPIPDARYFLGKSMKMNGKYQEAVEQLQQYISESTDDALKAKAQIELDGAKMALKAKDNELILVENVGNGINTPFADMSPTMLNTSEIYYASFQRDDYVKLDGKEGNYHARILQASKNGDKWGKGEALNKEINREGFHTVNPTFSNDKRRMYFNRSQLSGNVVGASEIYVSEMGSDGWAPPLRVAGINGSYIAKHPAVGDLFNSEVLFFSSNMDGGKGGDDLYYSTRKSDGSYELPVNLGEAINTSGDEITPYYRDGKLYFSSNGLPGFGGFDVYVSTWDGVKWSKPINVGKGYNSPQDDIYFSIDKSGENGLLVSNRPDKLNKSLKSKTCCDDIYAFRMDKPLIDLNALVFDRSNNEIKGATVELVEMLNNKPGETEKKATSGNKASFKLGLEKTYMLVGSKDGYQPDTVLFNTVGTKKTATLEKKLRLRKVQKTPPVVKDEEMVVEINQPIRLNNIYYDYDDDKILPDAEADLNYLDTLMKKYPDMVIELSSHTDARGNDKYNQELSQRRAESAKKFLLAKGIKDNRIKAVGYGESQLLNECKNGVKCTDAEHRLNRRTEFKIIEGPTTIIIKKREKKANIPANETRTDKKEKGGPNIGTMDTVKPSKEPQPFLKWEKKMVDFGAMKRGEKRHEEYVFSNNSEEDAEIEIVTACECTKVDWTRGKIKPGAKGKIVADFDSTEKSESETITITIVMKNTDKVLGYPIIEEVKFKFDLKK